MKRTFREVKKLFLFVLLVCAVAGSLSFISTNKVSAHAEVFDDGINFVRHVPTLSDDFIDNRVIVTLRSKYSRVNGAIDLQSFSTTNIVVTQSTELNKSQNDDVFAGDKYSNKIVIQSVDDLMYISDPTKITNKSNFTQILSFTLKENSKENVLRVIEELEQLEHVLAAEPEYIRVAKELWMPPNDTWFGDQWGLGAAPGIQAQEAWTLTRGISNPRLRIGIFEGAIQNNHPDLRVIAGNFTPTVGADADHGTHVGGIIGAITHNAQGVSGIAQVEIALLNRATFQQSLVWAIANNIRIVNASFGWENAIGAPSPASLAEAEAIRVFGENGGLFIAAAGNNGNNAWGNADTYPFYPAGYGDVRKFPRINNVISVGSLDSDGARRESSNYGANSVHIYAPGGEILSTFPENRWGITVDRFDQVAQGYAVASGTSMAAPHVSGVAALMRIANPNLSAVQLRDAILNNGVPITVNIPGGGTHNTRSLNAFSAVGSQVFTTSVSGANCAITGLRAGFDLTGSITVPGIINGKTVTQIGSNAFEGCSGMTDISLPSSITNIGYYAFWNCTGLTSIEIPNSVTTIEMCAFVGCNNLTYMKLPFIGRTLGGTTDTHLGYIFGTPYPNAQNQTIPSSLKTVVVTGNTKIGTKAFNGCSNLTSVTMTGNITTIDYMAFAYCTGLTNIVIPNSVYSIGDSAFYYCSGLTGVALSSNLGSIGTNAFYGCSGLTNVNIPYWVNSIGNGAFGACSSLASIELPFVGNTRNGIIGGNLAPTYFGHIFGATSYNGQGSYIPASLQTVIVTEGSVSNYAFYGCSNLRTIKVDGYFTSVGKSAFEGCSSLVEISIPYLGNSAYGTGSDGYLGYYFGAPNANGNAYYVPQSLRRVTVRGEMVKIPDHAFENCYYLTEINVNCNSIGDYAFNDCWNLQSLEIGSYVTSIGDYSFYHCDALPSINIPSTVTGIGRYAFGMCGEIPVFNFPPLVTSISEGLFYGSSSNSAGFSIPSWITSIGNNAFYWFYYGIEHVTIPNGVISIGDSAFSNGSIRNVVIPDSVTSIGSGVFGGCENLTSVTLPSGITSISEWMFWGCYGLNFVIPGSVTTVGDGAFAYCWSLRNITIPGGVTSIGNEVFYNCFNLEAIYVERPLSAGIITLGSDVFSDCYLFSNIYVPDAASVTAYQAASGWSVYQSLIKEGSPSYSSGQGGAGQASVMDMPVIDILEWKKRMVGYLRPEFILPVTGEGDIITGS